LEGDFFRVRESLHLKGDQFDVLGGKMGSQLDRGSMENSHSPGKLDRVVSRIGAG